MRHLIALALLAWTQTGELTGVTFAVLIDGVQQPIPAATCVRQLEATDTYDCTAALPPLTAGAHQVQLVAEHRGAASEPSAPLTVVVTVQ